MESSVGVSLNTPKSDSCQLKSNRRLSLDYLDLSLMTSYLGEFNPLIF